MKLINYLKGKNSIDFANKLGIPYPYLWQIAKGKRQPSLSTTSGRLLINKIIEFTNGQVTLKDLRPDEYEFFEKYFNHSA